MRVKKRSCTVVATLLTFCPPCPPLRVNFSSMQPGGSLASTFGGLVGTGPGAGMGLLFVLGAFGGTLAGLGGYLFPQIRHAEAILPDYDAAPPNAPPAQQPA